MKTEYKTHRIAEVTLFAISILCRCHKLYAYFYAAETETSSVQSTQLGEKEMVELRITDGAGDR